MSKTNEQNGKRQRKTEQNEKRQQLYRKPQTVEELTQKNVETIDALEEAAKASRGLN